MRTNLGQQRGKSEYSVERVNLNERLIISLIVVKSH